MADVEPFVVFVGYFDRCCCQSSCGRFIATYCWQMLLPLWHDNDNICFACGLMLTTWQMLFPAFIKAFIMDTFLFIAAILSMLAIIAIIHLVYRHTKLKALVTQIAFHMIKQTEALLDNKKYY